jgi:hypothetical protein
MGTKSYANGEEVSIIFFRLRLIVARNKKGTGKCLHVVLMVP